MLLARCVVSSGHSSICLHARIIFKGNAKHTCANSTIYSADSGQLHLKIFRSYTAPHIVLKIIQFVFYCLLIDKLIIYAKTSGYSILSSGSNFCFSMAWYLRLSSSPALDSFSPE